jgi:hypothetical protein
MSSNNNGQLVSETKMMSGMKKVEITMQGELLTSNDDGVSG